MSKTEFEYEKNIQYQCENVGYKQIMEFYKNNMEESVNEIAQGLPNQQSRIDLKYSIVEALQKELEQAYKEVNYVLNKGGGFSEDYQNPEKSTEISNIDPNLDTSKKSFLIQAYKAYNTEVHNDAVQKGFDSAPDDPKRIELDTDAILETEKKRKKAYLNEFKKNSDEIIKNLAKTGLSVENQQEVLKDLADKSINRYSKTPYDSPYNSQIQDNIEDSIRKNLGWKERQIIHFFINIGYPVKGIVNERADLNIGTAPTSPLPSTKSQPKTDKKQGNNVLGDKIRRTTTNSNQGRTPNTP